MSEQEQVVETEVVQERQFSADEERAMVHGWVPKDQWQGDPDEWVPAKVFNTRGDLFGRIAKDKRKISELEQTVGYLVEDRHKAFEDGYKKGLQELRAERREALEAGDVDKVEQIEDKIEEFKEDHAAKKQELEKRVTQNKQPENPVFDTWHVDNDWYMADQTLTIYANEVAQEMVSQAQAKGVQVDYPKLLQEIARKTKQKFPEKFGRKMSETKTSAVEGGTTSADDKSTVKRTNKFSESDLTDMERRIMETTLKQNPKMTKAEYLDQVGEYVKRKG